MKRCQKRSHPEATIALDFKLLNVLFSSGYAGDDRDDVDDWDDGDAGDDGADIDVDVSP